MKRPRLFRFICVGVVCLSGLAGRAQDRAAWLKEARWGVMTHYLADWVAREAKETMSVEKWNEWVDRLISITPHEDYTAGEINDLEKSLIRRAVDGKVDGARIHKLSYLGQTWGKGERRYKDLNQVVIPWTRKIVEAGGAMTWDVPVQRNGLIP